MVYSLISEYEGSVQGETQHISLVGSQIHDHPFAGHAKLSFGTTEIDTVSKCIIVYILVFHNFTCFYILI
ncbi:hypothetical protein Hamer_G026675 [Homarus americanus]|uniref:Uncharacterized protein n=1 Tax=Homarus americanus TaxID=6706 RepID=A0A8J5JT88_HOMAM|nr:hypothetical protein Hamer_G026675 [Homarus americanus]